MTRPSLIPGSVTVEGELTGRGDLVILGRVLGDITIDGLLIIEEGGAVRGEVRASSVVIRGALAGDAVGQESVRVEAGAQVVGDLRAPRIKVADGAQLKGRVQIGAEAGLSPVKQVVPGPRVRRARPAGLTEAMSLSAHAPAPVVAAVPVAALVAAVPAPVRPPAPVVRAAAPVSPPASFTRPPLSMPRLTRVAAERR
jgi:cytoskeletal protein CcmA (bactofilin family)